MQRALRGCINRGPGRPHAVWGRVLRARFDGVPCRSPTSALQTATMVVCPSLMAVEPPQTPVDVMNPDEDTQEAATTIAVPALQEQQNGHGVLHSSAATWRNGVHKASFTMQMSIV